MLVKFRTLGLVTSQTAVHVNTLGTNGLFTAIAPLDRSFQLFDLANLHLIFASKEIKSTSTIRCVSAHNEYTLCAAGPAIHVFKRADIIHVLTLSHEDVERSEQVSFFKLIILGDLVLAACSDNCIRIWNWKSTEFVKTISLDPSFMISDFIHPSTYVNKILISSMDGRLQLWNFASLTMIYEFPSVSTQILTLSQSPAIDVIALGLQNGQILIKNIKTNTLLKQFYHDTQSAVTCITFRTSDDNGTGMMVSAGNDGSVFVWDLEKSRMIVRVGAGSSGSVGGDAADDAHMESVHTAQFLSGQPVLVTASRDNSIKEWIFDNEDGHPRLWKSRSGHREPPNRIRFVGPDPTTLLSTGVDGSLRKYSTIQDQRNLEFSRKNAAAKKFNNSSEDGLPNEIIGFDACDSGINDWDDIVTVEAKSSVIKTWKMKRGAIGKHLLPVSDKSLARAACISPCGNFTFIGSSLGGIDMYNMQSGNLRKTFSKKNGHTKAIVGLAADALSLKLISCSLDCTIKIWNIRTGSVLDTITTPVSISNMYFHKDSNIAAFACDDLCVRIVDVEIGKIVREFRGHSNRILDLSLSPDARWLLTSGLDGTIKLWDIPSSAMIGSLRVDPATSVSFSIDGNYIASSHASNRGIVLWANTTLFDIAPSAIPKPMIEGYEVPEIEADNERMDTSMDEGDLNANPDGINQELIQLSNLPLSRVQLLMNLESIQKRKKPTEAIKKPDDIPFFLGSVSATTAEAFFKPAEFHTVDATRHISKKTLVDYTATSAEWHGNVDYINKLIDLTPSALDLEIRSYEMVDFEPFLDILLENSRQLCNYEFLQCVINLFVEAHGSDLVLREDLRKKLELLKSSVAESWRGLEDLFHANLSILEFLRS